MNIAHVIFTLIVTLITLITLGQPFGMLRRNSRIGGTSMTTGSTGGGNIDFKNINSNLNEQPSSRSGDIIIIIIIIIV